MRYVRRSELYASVGKIEFRYEVYEGHRENDVIIFPLYLYWIAINKTPSLLLIKTKQLTVQKLYI